ncbi:MAG: DUF2185 domain-containing protein [Hyphomonadaceae bacterium]
MTKQFKLSGEEVLPLAEGYGACIATDMITVDGFPVRWMYREEPDNEDDSGWRFLSGFEDDAYMDDPANHGVYDVNTIANLDREIIPFLDAAIGSAFERTAESERFQPVDDEAEEDGELVLDLLLDDDAPEDDGTEG